MCVVDVLAACVPEPFGGGVRGVGCLVEVKMCVPLLHICCFSGNTSVSLCG